MEPIKLTPEKIDELIADEFFKAYEETGIPVTYMHDASIIARRLFFKGFGLCFDNLVAHLKTGLEATHDRP